MMNTKTAVRVAVAMLFLSVGTLTSQQRKTLASKPASSSVAWTRLVYKLDMKKAIQAGKLTQRTERFNIVDATVAELAKRLAAFKAKVKRISADRIRIDLPVTASAELLGMQQLIEARSPLEMRMLAAEGHSKLENLDLAEEKRRLLAWLKANEKHIEEDPLAISIFNELPRGMGGTLPGRKKLRWVPIYRKHNPKWKPGAVEESRWIYEGHSKALSLHNGKGPYFLPIDWQEEYFSAVDLDPTRSSATVDETGRPALFYQMKASRAKAYSDWSHRHKDYHCAIIINDWVHVAPVFISQISGPGIISCGGFSTAEVKKFVRALRLASLSIRLVLESKKQIGAQRR